MNRKFFIPPTFAGGLIVTLLSLLSPTVGSAGTLTWDGNTSSSGLQDGGGTWDTSSTNRWWNGSGYVAWNNANQDTAVIGVNSGAAGTITLSVPITAGGITFNPAGSGLYTISGNTLTLAGATPTITSNASSLTTPFGPTITSNLAGSNGLTVTGNGSVRLAPTTTMSLTGPITITRGAGGNGITTFGGVLRLDFANTGVNASNLINSSSALTMQGGTLAIINKAGNTNSQAFNGLTLNAGGNYIRSDSTGAAALSVLNLGAITRNTGSWINITLTGTPGTVTTSTANTAGSILGGWAVRSNDWVTVSGGNVTSMNSYTPDAWAVGNNTNVTSTSIAPAANSTTNSLRFSGSGGSANQTVTLSGTNVITSGGILNSTIHTGTTTFTGGALTSGNGQDLIVTQYGAELARLMTFSSNIVDNGVTPIGFTMHANGSNGVIVFDGTAKTYTGPTTITAGQLRTDVANVLPTGTAVNITNYSTTFPASLNLNNNNQTIGSLQGGGSVLLGSGTLTIDGSTSTTYEGVISGTGSLVKQGSSTLTLIGHNLYTGTLFINEGTVVAGTGSSFNLSGGPVLTFGGTGTGVLSLPEGLTSNRNFILNATGTIDVAAAKTANFNALSNNISGAAGLTKTGAGTLILNAANTYAGNTTVQGGLLQVTGSLANNGPNKVFIAAPDSTLAGNPVLSRNIVSSYVGFGSTSIGGLGTSAELLHGSTTGATLDMTWRTRAGVENSFLVSNVIGLTGTGSDKFVLQLSYDSSATAGDLLSLAAQGDFFLGWLDAGQWINAVLGNTGGAPDFVGDVVWSNSYTTLGQWGFDSSNDVVWAVLNHNSEFAVYQFMVPEPSTWTLLLLLGLAGLWRAPGRRLFFRGFFRTR